MHLSHIDVPCTNSEASKDWYLAALKPLGACVQMQFPEEAGNVYGIGSSPDNIVLWLGPVNPGCGEYKGAVSGHICFKGDTRGQVDAFHAAAIAAGGTDNGKPGLRPHYHPNYYAAFVRDLDGRNIELVTFSTEE
ncbi:glyoxalase/bleomycin resistance protein/dioxygenase [Chytriomyces sp. MP71]|nr:glyoxalase/bleomycin resistance protein/dioxygenase [Chytriomyces sp. MP71]